MNFAFSEEQEELRRTVRQFLEAKSPETEVRRLMETDRGLRPRGVEADGPGARPPGPRDPRGVRRPGLHVRRARHRARGDGPRAAVRARTSRRSCSPPNAILQRRHRRRRRRRCCPASRRGETIATLAFTEPNGQVGRGGHHDGGHRGRATATRSTGTKMFVIDGHTADLIVVVARTAGTTGDRRHLVLHRRRRRRRA